MPSGNRLLRLATLLLLCFLLTTGEAGAQGPDDHGELLDNTATPLTLGTTATGLISPDGDMDVFRFEIIGVATDVWIYTQGGISDSVGILYDSNGTPIAYSDDSVLSTNTSHFYIGANLGPGTYYIAVSGYDTATGPYSLHTRTGTDQDRTIDLAGFLTLGTPGEGIIGPAGDLDMFKIDLSTQADVVMYTSGDVDTVGVLFDYRGVQLTDSDDSPISEGSYDFFIGETLDPGIYYIAVLGYATSTGPYKLHVEEVTDQDGPRFSATDLALDSSEIGFIASRDDEDYFRLTLSTSTDVWIYAVGPTDTVGELLDSSNTLLAYNDDSVFSEGLTSFFMAKNLTAGIYYIEISGFAERTGSYRVHAESAGDPGNTVATAEELKLGTPEIGLIDPVTGTAPNRTADEDLFKLDLRNPEEVLIYTTGGVDTIGTLLQSDGTTPLETDDDGGTGLNFSIERQLEAGTYYIRVEGYQGGTEPEPGPYALFAKAVESLNPEGYEISGTISPGFDEEYYKLVLTSPTDVWIYASGPLDTVGDLYDSDLNGIAFNDDSRIRGRRYGFQLRETLAAGTYYVKVSSYGTETGLFAIKADTATNTGSSTGGAKTLELDVPTTGKIDPAADEDYFRLDLTGHTNVILYARSDVGFPLTGEVLDSRGRVIGRVNEFTGPVGFLIREGFGPGTYYVKVTAPYDTRGPLSDPVPYTVHALEDSEYTAFVNDCQVSAGDPLYVCQWHLKNEKISGEDINVEPVWAESINGTGVNVAVVDDGMDHYHEDLSANVDTSRNYDYTGRGDVYDSFEHHGTATAGLIAARDNNIGVRGVVPRATIYGYNFLANSSSLNEVDAMGRNRDLTAISSNSWGGVDGPGLVQVSALWEAAVTTGVEKGYGGKGTFYAWAAGNGGDNGDNSNLEEYTNFYAITPVCAVNDSGIRSDFSELGANLWVCAPSNDLRAGYRGIVTIENSDRYQNTFGGTSASTPIVSGVAALLRDANPELTWRDLKLILAASARKNDPDNSGWEDGAFKYGSNTGRYHFNHEYGFGVVDAKAAVDLSKEWTTVPPLESATKTRSVNRRIFDAPASGATDTLTLTTDIAFIEFVEVRTNFQHSSFRDLEIELESPAGKVSTLVGPYETDIGLPLYGEFRFGAAKHLGENPNGTWTLRVTDRVSGVSGTLDSWTIKVYGHMLTPAAPAVDSVTPGEDSLIVAWSAPAVNRGTGVTSYDLRHIPTAADETEEDNWTVVGDIWTATHGGYLERRVTGLAGNTQYDVQVRGVNQAGAGPWSETATGTPKVSAATCSTGSVLTTLPSSPELAAGCDALLGLRDTLAGGTPLNWSASLSFDQWDGVMMGGAPRQVMKLELSGKSLAGRIPPGLGGLASLEILDLSDNDLTGTIPTELGSLTNLAELRLNQNQLTGGIPAELGSLTSLEVLALSDNGLTGNASTELGRLTNLTELRLNQNQLTGGIPAELGSLTSLEVLALSDNGLTGGIPTELQTLTLLQYLDLSQNRLAGEIPSGLDDLTRLQELVLAGNDLSGGIPSELGTRLASLERLDLSENGLTGEIPDRLTYITGLVELDLSNNQLSGEIPADLRYLNGLEKLYLNDNQLTGAIPVQLGRLTGLIEIHLSGNQLTGCIPKELRDAPDNDLGDLGLAYCDVRLSGLTIGTATLTPAFDPARTDYTAVVGPSRVTVTPTGEPGVTLKFFDGSGGEIPDADDTTDGHQIDFGDGTATIKIEVTSEDGKATHTYTIEVSRAGMPGAPSLSSPLTPGEASLTITWTAPGDTGGAEIISYDLRHIKSTATDKSDANWTVVERGWTTGLLTATVRGLTGDTQYDVQARAFNGAHSGPWSATATGTPKAGTCKSGSAVTYPAANLGLVSDCEVLLAAKDALQGTRTLMPDWSVNNSIGQWDGVIVDAASSRVTGLALANKQMTGRIPSSLGRLDGLKTLALSGNQLAGTIPAQLGNLASLQELKLSQNQLTGMIPTELGRLFSLTTLELGGNKLAGEIPYSLRDLAGLKTLDLSDNQLEGGIPYWLGSLANLEKLRLDNNRLDGEIPYQLGSVTTLVELHLNGNQLTGNIPSQLGSLTNLVQIRLDNNQLEGGIPSFASLTSLRELHLHGNLLTGPVPSWLGGLTMLEELDLSKNGLTGTILVSLDAVSNQSGQANLINLRVLHLNENRLTGAVSSSLENLLNLEKINLAGNRFTGEIPPELGNIAKLEFLALSRNRLTGPVPGKLAGLGSNSVLKELHLGGNQLTGEIPTELGSLAMLEQLDLSKNELSGEIPPELGSLAALMTLRLNDNGLTGSMPAGLGNLSNLEELNLGSNRLTGEIPSLSRMINLKVLVLHDNHLTGTLPSWLGDLTNLTVLSIWGNQLPGPVPADLGDLDNLEILFLSHNPLGGAIPAALGDLTNLRRLDIHHSQLTGDPPAALGNLRNLEWLYLSGNDLTGPIPSWIEGFANLQRLHLEQNLFTGEIPSWLGSLTDLEMLFLSQNRLTGCIPKELREVPDHDLAYLDLVYCDVLLSGLSISPGTLTPQFDPDRTDYTAEARASRITLTPANEYGAAFRFLDVNDAELADADDALAGHQIDLGVGDTTVKVEVVSQDRAAAHTYTIIVTLEDVISRYDRDGNGAIDRNEAIAAVSDYFNNTITREEVIMVIVRYFASV